LNTSLTEAFCIAILEAVCCGLTVVSTNVGGVPELLPAHMLHLTEPTAAALLSVLDEVIPTVRRTPHAAVAFHDEVASRYSWHR
jgi:phosphatidylinositol glycan class A protein